MKTAKIYKYETAYKIAASMIILLVIIYTLPAKAQQDKTKLSAPLNSEFYCMVKRVHDGDTFTCNTGQKIRLWAIDTPEVPPKVDVAEPGGYEARNLLKTKILNQNLKCLYKGDSYDRKVAQCFLKKNDVAIELIQKGYARELKHFSKGYYTKYKEKTTDFDHFLDYIKNYFVH